MPFYWQYSEKGAHGQSAFHSTFFSVGPEMRFKYMNTEQDKMNKLAMYHTYLLLTVSRCQKRKNCCLRLYYIRHVRNNSETNVPLLYYTHEYCIRRQFNGKMMRKSFEYYKIHTKKIFCRLTSKPMDQCKIFNITKHFCPF